MFESLEPRQLLTLISPASTYLPDLAVEPVSVVGDRLVVHGTQYGDSINVNVVDASNVDVVINSTHYPVALTSIYGITVYAAAGDDRVSIDTRLFTSGTL